MADLPPQKIQEILEQQKIKPIRLWFQKPRYAAVALCLRHQKNGLEVLMIQRAKRKGDPWSGHMAFPGGHQDPEDTCLKETAIRETHEEVGLDLKKKGFYLGPLNPMRGKARGLSIRLVIQPQVFALHEDVPLKPNHEVADTVWIPLKELLSGKYDSLYSFPPNTKVNIPLPCWRYHHYVIWGMSYRMLQSFMLLLEENSQSQV